MPKEINGIEEQRLKIIEAHLSEMGVHYCLMVGVPGTSDHVISHNADSMEDLSNFRILFEVFIKEMIQKYGKEDKGKE